MGDLNCRLDDTSRKSVLQAIETDDMQKLLKLDQVRLQLDQTYNETCI